MRFIKVKALVLGHCCRGFGEFLKRPENLLGPGASFCSSGLSLVEGFRGGLSLAGLEGEGGGGLWLAGGA